MARVSPAGAIARHTLLIVLAAATLVPLFWTFSSSLRQTTSLFEFTTPLGWRTFIASPVTWDHYRYVFTQGGLARAMGNSVFVSTATAVLAALVNGLAGFAFAKYRFPGRDVLFSAVLITFMVPFEAIVIPLFLTVNRLGWLNTYQALIAPAVADGLSIFLFRQFFQALPDELLDAARVDGASALTVFARVITPLSMPAFVTAAIMTFLFQWEAFFWPLVATSGPQLQVVQVNVSLAITQEQTYWGHLFASATIASLVPMAVFLVLQRYYVQGIAAAGLR
jgi:ABC-type glycerol-3-phosphate transport system permease component